MGVTFRLVVMVSGAGSNAEALMNGLEASTDVNAAVVAMGSDQDAPGLEFARHRGIPTFISQPGDFSTREEWGQALIRLIGAYAPDLVVLSGFMRLLPANVVEAFAPRIINTHPAYLPEFPGAHGVRDALAAGVTETGASVIVVDTGVDTGPIIAQERVAIEPGDTEDTLHPRIKQVERRLLFDVVTRIATGALDLTTLDGGHHS